MGEPQGDPWRRRRVAFGVTAVVVALVCVAWAIVWDGPWVLVAAAIPAVLSLDAMRRSKREWQHGSRGGREFAAADTTGARIVIERPAVGPSDRMRGYRVLVDDEAVGVLLPGRTIEVPVEPGEHVVQLRIDWTRSRAVPVRAEPNDVVRLEGRPRPAWAALFWITLGARRYPSLRVAA